MADPRRILGVGVATVDVVNRVAAYPAEDAEVRALANATRRGGNCANTLAVLADLGHHCAFAGTLAADAGGALISTDLGGRGVDLTAVRRIAGAATPTSWITISAATGSRTIVHYRNLPEYDAGDFAGIELAPLVWAHFEGRNVPATRLMLDRVRRERPDLPLSLELEKPRPGIDALLRFHPSDTCRDSGPRVLILARAFAAARGADDPAAFLRTMARVSDAELLVAPWGAAGAWGLARGGAVVHAPAAPPAELVDTLGAGDVFNAALIDGLLAGLALPDLLARANRLAGCACGMEGLDGVVAAARADHLL